MAAYRIETTNGVDNQYKKFKPGTTLEEAKQKMIDLFQEDYLGLDYYLLDEHGNELFVLEQD